VLEYLPAKLQLAARHLKETLFEALFVFGFGLAPILVTALLAHPLAKKDIDPYLLGILTSGELILISLTIVGPMLYLVLKEYGKSFPYRRLIVGMIFIVAIMATMVIAFNSIKFSMDEDFIVIISIIVSLACSLIWLFVTYLKNSLEDAPELMRQGHEQFDDKWRAWHV
jgi:predicted neutral ceramidase superfamily lipid hydrolase